MSALAGLVRFDGGSADPDTVSRMIDCVEHRGPDWRGVWSAGAGGAASLGYCCRRSGPAQPLDEQPIIDPFTGSALVFDGRLDNRRELGRVLAVADVDLRSDAQLVLASYARWGRDAVAHLLGDFAFALWDPAQRRLLLSRDALGLRAISYVRQPRLTAFATESRQLLRVEGVGRNPNLGFFAEWLAGRMSHPTETIFQGVERLPPAHIAAITDGGVELTRYWDIDPLREIRYKDDRHYVEHFRTLYRDAVRARLRGHDRVGVLLSGGLDSASIVGMAARSSTGVETRAYTLAFNGLPDSDDEESAACVARACNVPFFCAHFQPTALEFYVGLAAVLEDTIPAPVGDGRVTLATEAARDGCGLLLDGSGGDEWFGGAHQHTADLLRSGRLIAAVNQLLSDAARPDFVDGIGVLAKSSIWPLFPAPLRRGIKRLLPQPDRVPRGIARQFAAQVALVDRTTAPLTDPRFASIATGTIYVAATHPYCAYSWDEVARHDALCGIDLAAPLLDRRLAEFAIALPEEQRWGGSDTKRVLRDAMEGFVPPSTRLRPKADGASAQVTELSRLHVTNAFGAMQLADEGIIDRAAVDDMHREMMNLFAAADPAYKIVANELWTIALGECIWRGVFGLCAALPAHRGWQPAHALAFGGARG
jgi:asparagine synthase (glutamine-hydrolysing)